MRRRFYPDCQDKPAAASCGCADLCSAPAGISGCVLLQRGLQVLQSALPRGHTRPETAAVPSPGASHGRVVFLRPSFWGVKQLQTAEHSATMDVPTAGKGAAVLVSTAGSRQGCCGQPLSGIISAVTAPPCGTLHSMHGEARSVPVCTTVMLRGPRCCANHVLPLICSVRQGAGCCGGRTLQRLFSTPHGGAS